MCNISNEKIQEFHFASVTRGALNPTHADSFL